MAQQEVKIFFKVDGIDGYITDLNELQAALSKTDTETKDLSKSTDDLSKETKKSVTSINSLNQELNELQKELNETEVGSEAFVELQNKVKDAEKALADAKTGQQSFTDTLGNAPGAVGAVTKSVQGLGVAFKALLANPVVLTITLIVGALTALFKAFTSTKEGGEALDRVMAGVSAVFSVFTDLLAGLAEKLIGVFSNPKQAILDFGTAIKENIINRFVGIVEFIPQMAKAVQQLFERDFSGAAETAANALLKVTTGTEDAVNKINEAGKSVGQVISDVVNESQEATRLTKILQEVTDKERDLNIERAQQNALLAESKLKIDDNTLSIEERQKALDEVGAAESKLLEEELANEQRRLDALIALDDLGTTTKEVQDEIAAQKIKIAQLEEQSLNKQTELLGKQKALRAEEKAANDERIRLAEEQLQREFEISEELRRKKLDDRNLELDDLRLKYEQDVKAAGDNKELLLQLEEQYKLDEAAVNKKFDDEELLREQEKQQTIQDILNEYAEQEYANEEARILAELEQQYQADLLKLQQAGATAEQLAALDKAYQDKVTAQTKKGEEDREKLRKASAKETAKLVGDLFAGFQALNNARTADDEEEARKQFNINKAFGISSALINTGLAISDVLASEKGGAIKKTIAAAAIGAQGLAQVLAIKNQQFNPGSVGGDIGSIEQPTFNPQAAIDTRNQELADLQNAGEEVSLADTQQQPIRAYVVSTEVESSLAANERIEQLSRL